MSRPASIPKYALHTKPYGNSSYHTPMIWEKHYGRPTEANLKKWVEKYHESLLPGGCNSHIGSKGTIMKAEIRYNYAGGVVLASYSGPSFMVLE